MESGVNGNNAPVPAASVASTVAVNNGSDYVAVDATAAVQAWLSGTTNSGFIITPNTGVNISFDSKESTTTSHPAILSITLVGSGAPRVRLGLPDQLVQLVPGRLAQPDQLVQLVQLVPGLPAPPAQLARTARQAPTEPRAPTGTNGGPRHERLGGRGGEHRSERGPRSNRRDGSDRSVDGRLHLQ